MKRLYHTTTSYNHFGFPFCKPTDFFTNYVLQLPKCRRMATDLRICGSNRVEIRRRMNVQTGDDLTRLLYRIPPSSYKKFCGRQKPPKKRPRSLVWSSSSRCAGP